MLKKTDLKILTINLDYTLAMDSPDFGDAQERNIDYGKYVEKIISITHSRKKMGLKKKILSDQVEIYPTSSTNPIFFIFDALKLSREIFFDHKIDLVLTQDPFITGLVGWLIKKRHKCKYLIHFHGDFWENKYWLREKWYNFILLLLSKFLVKRADGIKVVSFGIKEKLIKSGIKKRKIRVIPTPVDLSKFIYCSPDKVRNLRKKVNENWKTIINVGRNDPAKDYRTLLKVIKIVREKYGKLAFWQIGAKIKLDDNIIFGENMKLSSIGKISQDKLTNYYHASDIYVSSSRHESFGKVLIEAMAAGLPVVATATTGSKDIVQEGINGFLVPVGDSEALARKILFLLNNPKEAKKIGANGRKFVKEKFDYQKLIEEIIDFWQDLVC